MTHATLTTPRDDTYLAVAAFLARYSNENTRALYEIDLRIYVDWCAARQLRPLVDVQRVHVELFGRWLDPTSSTPSAPSPPWRRGASSCPEVMAQPEERGHFVTLRTYAHPTPQILRSTTGRIMDLTGALCSTQGPAIEQDRWWTWTTQPVVSTCELCGWKKRHRALRIADRWRKADEAMEAHMSEQHPDRWTA